MSQASSPRPGGADPAAVEAHFATDHWSAKVVGHRAQQGRGSISFTGIAQPWLREAAKSYSRFRLATGSTWTTVGAGADCLRRLSSYISAVQPGEAGPEVLTRGFIERYCLWLSVTGYSGSTRSSSLIFLRSFLEYNRRFGWCPEIPDEAAVYQDDLPARDKPAPRWLSEFVMAQMEDPAALELLEPTLRHLIILIMESGLRAGDACGLPFNPMIPDSSGWPCLRYWNHKTAVEQVVPLSEKAATAIKDQQAFVNIFWPTGSEWLFPTSTHFSREAVPVSYSALSRQLRAWCARINLRDEAGVPISVSAHQFRHTLGTRLINSGVPPHIVQRILGHASPGMTDVYARLHDSTIRTAFDVYQTKRVDIAGAVLNFDPDSATADAEWLKHNLAGLGQPAQRLLRTASPAGVPSSQRLSDLSSLPDHRRVPTRASPACQGQSPPHPDRRGPRPGANGREPPAHPGGPGAHHPGPGRTRDGRWRGGRRLR